jgi:hypothetical protein
MGKARWKESLRLTSQPSDLRLFAREAGVSSFSSGEASWAASFSYLSSAERAETRSESAASAKAKERVHVSNELPRRLVASRSHGPSRAQ